MAKFRFIITDLGMGYLRGTNDEEVAQSCAECEDFYVFDSQSEKWIACGVNGLEEVEIEEFKS